MHISDGVLTGPVLAAGAVVAAGGVGLGLRRMHWEHTPRVAVMTAVFFLTSLMHVPVGPASVHLVLNGLAGIILGWSVFPAMGVALLLQALLFQHGGLTVWGVNTAVMALPALVAHYVFRAARRMAGGHFKPVLAAGILGATTPAASALLQALAVASGGRALINLAALMLLANLPVVFIDGLVTFFAVAFLFKARPDLLDVSHQA